MNYPLSLNALILIYKYEILMKASAAIGSSDVEGTVVAEGSEGVSFYLLNSAPAFAGSRGLSNKYPWPI
jgi:hypothetical protein